jgi:hypothetical protein
MCINYCEALGLPGVFNYFYDVSNPKEVSSNSL